MSIGEGADPELNLRVSVATLDRVIFPHPEDGMPMLALERKGTVEGDSRDKARVRAQPFGGGVRILDPASLEVITGPIHFDSERSKEEQDFRILIHDSDWGAVRQFCLEHLATPNDAALEAVPDRELFEEFEDVLGTGLKPDQYAFQPTGFVVENDARPTHNVYARGLPTVRIYRLFEVTIVDNALCAAMLDASQKYSDQDVERLALVDDRRGGKGRANVILTLPLNRVTQAYLATPPELRYHPITIDGHVLDTSVMAVLEDVEAQQYQRL